MDAMDADEGNRSRLLREWIILTLCFGLGAHVTLGVILHGGPDWPLATSGFYGLLISMGIYLAVQVCRSVYWLLSPDRTSETN